MIEPMLLLIVVIVSRVTRHIIVWRSAIGLERARAEVLADIVRRAHNGPVMVTRRADGEMLIIFPAATTTGNAA